MEDEILNKNFDDDSETENYSLNESSDVSTDEECDSILTTVQMSSSNCFIGKNGYKWNKNHAIIGRTRYHNIIAHLPGLKGPAKPKPNCGIDIFNLFFTAAIIKQISEFTNSKIEEFRQRISDLTKSTYSNFTSEIEIRAFLGLLYLAGVYKSGHENVESLFASDGTGRDIFRSVMSVKRFLFLLLCIRFDNFKTRCKEDRLSPIRDIFQTIIEKFQSCYTPAEYLTVDEMLVGFRGKCPFKIYIPSKPNKYGIKIVILADSRTHYMYNAMVYTGKSKTPKSKELSLPTQIVLDISRPLWKSNRNITADNWFTSIELVDKLKEHGLTYLGTMRKNKPQIPPQFQPHPKRESGTSIFGFSGTKTLVSYVPKKRKSVILISSMHHDNKCDETTGKPDIIMYYNLTKGGVDTIDQMVSNFSTSRRSRRWPLALFYALLDITALNSYIIFNYQIDKRDQKERSTYIVDLGRSLIDEHLATHNLNSLPLELQTTMKKFKNNDGSSTSRGSTMPQESDTPKRCYKCPSKNAGKVKTLCSVRLFIFEILFIMEDEILNMNFDNDSETENYSLNESSDVSTDEECDSILTTVQMSSSNCFIGKNGYKWNKNHAIIGRTRSHNIITHLPGLKGPAKPKPNCGIDIFNLFFTAAIIKQISEFTNAKIEEFRQRISDLTKSTYSNFTSEIEIRAFLGLLYLAGVYKSGHENIESLFASDGTGRDIFRSVMSVKRFLSLLLCIRFDNFKTRCKEDRLSPIRDIFQTIIEKIQSCYTPAEYLTVDEMLVGFRRKCPFKIYIPSKPNKYGIKIVILADSRTHYMYNAMVYTGKSKTPKSKELSLPTQIVLDISRPLWKSNRNITADNWFTSIELVDKLKEHGLTYLGTMRKNKPQIPPQFQPHPKRESGTSIFGFSGTKTLVSYVPKKRKSVILISSMHHNNKSDETTGKPDIIMDYNLTKGGVDTIDQMVSNFSTSRRSRRWPLALFYALLDITALNFYIIFNYQIDKKDQKERSTFIVDLGRSLIDEHLATRNLNSLPLELQTTIKKFKNNDGSSTSRGSTMPQESDTPK
ncbi:hypothetical protein LAZ67_23002315, partial [Cordylochernes scorpioides]